MNVWVRVSSHVAEPEGRCADGSLKVTSELAVTLYASKALAEEGRKNVGGILLEVTAASLGLDGQNEFEKDVLLVADEQGENHSPATASFAVCFDGLPYTMVPNGGPGEPPQGDIAEFGPEANAWFDALEKETGCELHQ